MTKHKNYKPLTKVREELKDKYKISDYNMNILKDLHSRKYPIYTNCMKVSASGMNRQIDVFYIKNNQKIDLVSFIEELKIYKCRGGSYYLSVSGCGMDMGFSVVYNLSGIIFPYGFKLNKKDYGRNGDKSGYDENGGYALTQRWF